MRLLVLAAAAMALLISVAVGTDRLAKGDDRPAQVGTRRSHNRHHRRHGHRGRRLGLARRANASSGAAANATGAAAANASAAAGVAATEASIVEKLHAVETELTSKAALDKPTAVGTVVGAALAVPAAHAAVVEDAQGRLRLGGPLPPDFGERFRHAAAQAAGCSVTDVRLLGTPQPAADGPDSVFVVDFEAPASVVHSIEDQAADPESQLAAGNLHRYLVADDDESQAAPVAAVATASESSTEGSTAAFDVDTQMPYGELEPFGREDTGQELTESSIKESNVMVDQLEKAEVAEEKRAVFRALTRLRGAAITAFDGIARSQTGNVDEYNKIHQWRRTHPLNHLADEESDVSQWAFPDDADF